MLRIGDSSAPRPPRTGPRRAASGGRPRAARSLSAAEASPPTVELPPEGPAAARLRLVEDLLGAHDVAECLECGLAWLDRTHAVRRSMCLGRPIGERLYRSIGSRGLDPERGDAFAIAVDARDHPLIRVVRHGRVRSFPAAPAGRSRHRPATPFGEDAFHALPLLGATREEPIGLLLIDGAVVLTPEIEWFAQVVARKLDTLARVQADGARDRELAHERALLNTIINAITDPILLSDIDGRMLMANTQALRLFMASEEQSAGRRDAVSLNTMLFSAALSSRAIEQNGAMRRELTLVNPSDGSDLLFELLSVAADDKQSGTTLVSILRNVSDLRHAMAQIEDNYRKLKLVEADARAERDRLNLVINSVADPIVVTDAGGSISLVNGPAERLFTTPPDASAAVQRRVRTNDARFSSFVAGLLLKDEVRRVDNVSLVDPENGKLLPVEAIAGKVTNAKGEMTAIVTILHDRREALQTARLYARLKQASTELERKVRAATTDIEHQNELLRQQTLALAQASSMKTQFLSNMSHEFRTPLNAILGYTSILRQGLAGRLGREANGQLDRIASNGQHLLSIVNEILDISQIEAGRMPLRVTTVNLAEMIEEVRAELEPIVRAAGLSVSVNVPADLPKVASDRQKLKQILLNLMSNAVKFTPRGSVGVAVRHDANAPAIQIEVSDSGIGIPEADQERIFEDFLQLDNSPTRAYSGTGLGLAICRRFVRIIGGQISVRSHPGQGSTFTVTVPIGRA